MSGYEPIAEDWSGPGTSRRHRQARRLVVVAFVATVVAVLIPVLLLYHGEPVEQSTFRPSTRAKTTSGTPARDGHYDYIIVGGGPAGSALARMLSDDPDKQVLLLEAGFGSQAALGGARRAGLELKGAEPFNIFDIPSMWADVAHHKAHHFDEDGVLVAKVLGGCGVHNAMLYVRALESDFQRWNLSDWDFETAMRVSNKIERFDGAPGLAYHGYEGIVSTSRPEVYDVVSVAFLKTVDSMALPIRQDFNEPGKRSGAGIYHFNIANGLRHSAARAFLAPVVDFGGLEGAYNRARPNLHVVLGALVQRVLLETQEEVVGNSTGRARAVGVEYVLKRDPYEPGDPDPAVPYEQPLQVYTKKGTAKGQLPGEVIITAGALNTPKVLMNSGIGRRDYLRKMGIRPIVHSPNVGLNLQDHPAVALTYNRRVDPTSRSVPHPSDAFNTSMKDYMLRVNASLESSGQSVTGVKIMDPDEVVETFSKMMKSMNITELEPNQTFGLHGSPGISVGGFFRSDALSSEERATRLARARNVDAGTPEFERIKEEVEKTPIDEKDIAASLKGLPDIQLTLFRNLNEPHIVKIAQLEDVSLEDIVLMTVSLLSPEGRLRIFLDPADRQGRIRILPEPANVPGEILYPDPDVDSKAEENLNYHLLLTEHDRQALARGLTLARALMGGEPVRHFLQGEIWPGPAYTQIPDPNPDLGAWVSQNVYPNSHWCGTSAMGNREDSVLDHRLRVRHVQGLRVADASAIPTIPNGNVHSTVLLVATRAAELIREDAAQAAQKRKKQKR